MKSSTQVSVQIGPGPAYEFTDLQQYSIDGNVLTLCDTASFTIAPGTQQRARISKGDPLQVFMTDPRVNGGSKVRVMKGLVVDIDKESSGGRGSVWNISAADLGWHLVNNCGPLFRSLMDTTFEKLLRAVIMPEWGFEGVRGDNDGNRDFMKGRLNNARASIAAARTPENVFIPPVCFEAGDVIADKLIMYAKRAKRLVNVSSDGYLQFFKPRYDTPSDFAIHYHLADSEQSRLNNAKSARIRESIEGVYTDIICTGTVPIASVMPDRFNPHAGTFKGRFSDPNALPFPRLFTFSDSDALTNNKKNPMADDRALWKSQRGLFDAWVGEYPLADHVGGNVFIAPDAMCSLFDTVNGENGNHYISARRFERSPDKGTLTTVTLRKQGFLRA